MLVDVRWKKRMPGYVVRKTSRDMGRRLGRVRALALNHQGQGFARYETRGLLFHSQRPPPNRTDAILARNGEGRKRSAGPRCENHPGTDAAQPIAAPNRAFPVDASVQRIVALFEWPKAKITISIQG